MGDKELVVKISTGVLRGKIILTKYWWLLIILLLASIGFFPRLVIRQVHEMPAVFDQSLYEVDLSNGGTWIYKNGVLVDPVIHNKKYLYILHGAGYDFIRYSLFKAYNVDEINQEIVITHNIINFRPRSKITYQIIKVPQWRYQNIVKDDKVQIRIKFGSAFRLIEYDLREQTYSTIDQCEFAK